MSFLMGSGAPAFQRFAVPAATILIIVLAYGSQWLFATSPELEPGPLTSKEKRVFNTLLFCLWWTYFRACTVDPGRYEMPTKGEGETISSSPSGQGKGGDDRKASQSSDDEWNLNSSHNVQVRRRWCRKCAAPKPPRAHHCKVCRRCIPKMDHHCPWTGNCVSLQTFPHFLRFVAYTNASLWTLNYLLWKRFLALWETRHAPAYLGPTQFQLLALATLAFVSFLTTAAMAIILLTTVRGWALNMTTIEGWEVERHEAVLQRRGGYAEEDWWRSHCPEDHEAEGVTQQTNSMSLVIDPVEFPYDVGIFANMAQAMGTSNPLLWILPFAGNPRIAPLQKTTTTTVEDLVAKLSGARKGAAALGTGWYYPENELNDREGMWPPVDPDKVRDAQLARRRRQQQRQRLREAQERSSYHNHTHSSGADGAYEFDAFPDKDLSPEQVKEAFRHRQERDLELRRRSQGQTTQNIFNELEEGVSSTLKQQKQQQRQRNYYWVNSDGEHLGDYGVDEEAEADDYYVNINISSDRNEAEHIRVGNVNAAEDNDDDDIPLGELLRRRRTKSRRNEGDENT
ncbi:zf-DHHC-domain-containing protein [Xylariaceae sp. FL0594]|nr:zf-DHHC-domain-containing protein [Xylariaceae sp. FL0594]